MVEGEEYHCILWASKNDEGVGIEFDDARKSNVQQTQAFHDGNGEFPQEEGVGVQHTI